MRAATKEQQALIEGQGLELGEESRDGSSQTSDLEAEFRVRSGWEMDVPMGGARLFFGRQNERGARQFGGHFLFTDLETDIDRPALACGLKAMKSGLNKNRQVVDKTVILKMEMRIAPVRIAGGYSRMGPGNGLPDRWKWSVEADLNVVEQSIGTRSEYL